MGKFDEAAAFRRAVEQIAVAAVQRETAACLRVYKAKVTAAPNGSVCSVRLVGDNTVLSLPYSSRVASVSVGAVVWVAVLFNNMRNGIVWETEDFR